MTEEAVTLTLEAGPRKLTMSQRGTFKISLGATNNGTQTIDPHLHEARLLVNGEESMAWSLAIGNGRRPPKWYALPPGQTVSMTWSSLGESLFAHSGVFTLTLLFHETQLAPVEIDVLAADHPPEHGAG